MVGPNPPFSSGLGRSDRAEGRWIWPCTTQAYHPCLHLSGDNNPVLGLLSGGHAQKLLRAGEEQTGNDTFPKVVSQSEGPGCPCQEGARALPAPEPAPESLHLPLPCSATAGAAPRFAATDMRSLTAQSAPAHSLHHQVHGGVWQTASAEVFFLLEEPPPCLLQPQAGDTAPSCGSATFTHGLQRPSTQEREKQSSSLKICARKLLAPSPTPQQGGTSPSTTLCSHMETTASHASLRYPYQHPRGIPGLKTPSVCT